MEACRAEVWVRPTGFCVILYLVTECTDVWSTSIVIIKNMIAIVAVRPNVVLGRSYLFLMNKRIRFSVRVNNGIMSQKYPIAVAFNFRLKELLTKEKPLELFLIETAAYRPVRKAFP
jgi:hypothetical protein